jgi:hypothetical protein
MGARARQGGEGGEGGGTVHRYRELGRKRGQGGRGGIVQKADTVNHIKRQSALPSFLVGFFRQNTKNNKTI